MSHSQYPFPVASPPSWSDRTEPSWPPPESAWANSVTGRNAIIPPMDADPRDDDDASYARPWWLPTAREALAGFFFGATIGALVTAAVALDLADNRAAATPNAGRAAHYVESTPARPMLLTTPPTAPLRDRAANAVEVTTRRNAPVRRRAGTGSRP